MAAPSRVNFDNVTSMGVSYDWSHGEGAALPCTGITELDDAIATGSGKWVQRVKTIDLEVVNLDLGNAGGGVVDQLVAQQDDYVNTETHSIYANGQFAGYGKLAGYSVAEGSLANVSTTSLSYAMTDGGDPNQGEETEDPVSRTESIKVSRDIKGKSYTIDHSYGVSFGSEFDLISNHPLYKNDPEYKSVDGRLQLAEAEATKHVSEDVTNYNDYLDLSAYTLGTAFDLSKINDGCSGVFSTSNSTKNLINGDFSYNKSTVLRYTGADLSEDLDPYEISYTISWNQKKEEDGSCVVLTFNGSIVANEGTVPNCKSGEAGVSAGEIAQSGFEEWVSGPTPMGAQRVKEFYDAVVDKLSIPGATNYPLVEDILNYRKEECVPSIDKGGGNNGTIEFEFEMSTCPDSQAEDGAQYEHQQSTSFSYNQGGCKGATRRVTEISVEGSVNGQCGRNLGSGGGYPRWESVASIFENLKESGSKVGEEVYEGDYELRLANKGTSVNKYEGQADYNFTWTDSPLNDNCEAAGTTGCDPNFTVVAKRETTPANPRFVNTVTAAGIVTQQKGNTLPRADATIKIKNNPTGEIALTIATAMEEAKCQIDIHKPSCIIDTLGIQINKDQNNGVDHLSTDVNVGGIEL